VKIYEEVSPRRKHYNKKLHQKINARGELIRAGLGIPKGGNSWWSSFYLSCFGRCLTYAWKESMTRPRAFRSPQEQIKRGLHPYRDPDGRRLRSTTNGFIELEHKERDPEVDYSTTVLERPITFYDQEGKSL